MPTARGLVGQSRRRRRTASPSAELEDEILGARRLRRRSRGWAAGSRVRSTRAETIPRVASAAMGDLQIPAFTDVLGARQRIAPYLRPTPLLPLRRARASWSARRSGSSTRTTCRWAPSRCAAGSTSSPSSRPEERARGVISASTGNHGQSIAYAARLFGVRAIVCVPEGANPVKVASMRGLGAEIVVHGRDFDEARAALRRARRRARLPLHPLRRRAAPDRRRRDGDARAARGRARRSTSSSSRSAAAAAPRARASPPRRSPGHRGDRRAVRRGARRLPLVAGAPAWSRTAWRRSPRGSRRASRSSCRSGSCGSSSTTSCSSPTTRSARRS